MDGSRVLTQGHWQNCDRQALGAAGELLAAAQCALHGYQVYRPVADDRGIDFLIDLREGRHIEVQVKALRPPKGDYTFMSRKNFPLEPYRVVLLVVFPPDADQPSLFLIPASDWRDPPGAAHVVRDGVRDQGQQQVA